MGNAWPGVVVAGGAAGCPVSGMALQARLVHPAQRQPILAISTEHVRVKVSAGHVLPGHPNAGLPDDVAVRIAFTARRALVGAPVPPEQNQWRFAEWDAAGGIAEMLIGPHAPMQLEPGTWSVWVRADSAPEHVVRHAGDLTVV